MLLASVVRHLEASAIDDALDLFALLMQVKLISVAKRATDKDWLAAKPRLGKASRTVTAVYRLWSEQLNLVTEHGADLDAAARPARRRGPRGALEWPGRVRRRSLDTRCARTPRPVRKTLPAMTSEKALDPHSEITLRVNGKPHTLLVDHRRVLLDLLREDLGLTGSKKGCDHGQCGACTVLVDGRRVNGCLLLAVTLDGSEVTTIEGLGGDGEDPPPSRGPSWNATPSSVATAHPGRSAPPWA